MAPPSKAWVVIADSQVDADSPLDTTLVTAIRDDLVHLEEWVGMSYTAAQDHDHDGTNSKQVVTVAAGSIGQTEIAAGGVGQGELKTTSGSVSASSALNKTLPGGEYGFYPQVKLGSATAMNAQIINNGGSTSYVTSIYLSPTGGSCFAQQRYIQASPPYMIGNIKWGHFLYLLRDIATGKVMGAYEAEDPPWAYNGTPYPKDDSRNMQEIPHPFADYYARDPAADGLEIVLVDLKGRNVQGWRDVNMRSGKSILEDLRSMIPGKGTKRTLAAKGLPTIPNFSTRVAIIDP